MHRFALALAVWASFALGGVPAQSQMLAPRPAPVSPPFLLPVLGVDAPLLFQWTPVAPIGGYRIHLASGQRSVRATTLVAVHYELQISDRPDVASHVLYDRVVDSTTLLFENNAFADPGFTINQRPAYGLSGGHYFWRVRAVFAGPASAYSTIGSFDLRGGGVTSTAMHDFGIASITIAGRPIVGMTTPIVARVANVGTFDEPATAVIFTANGVVLGRAEVPALGAGAGKQSYVDVSVVWTPKDGPLAAITAQIVGVDQDARNNTATQTVFVASATPFATTLVGKLVASGNGFAVADPEGHVVAALKSRPGVTIDYAGRVGSRVEIDGALSAAGSDLVMVVSAIRPAR